MGNTLEQDIRVRIDTLINGLPQLEKFSAVIGKLKTGDSKKIVVADPQATGDVTNLTAAISALNTSISQISDKQPTRLSNAIKLLSSVVQGFAAAGQAIDFIKDWVPGFKAVEEGVTGAASGFDAVKDKVTTFAAIAGTKGAEILGALKGGLQALIGPIGEAVAGIGAAGAVALTAVGAFAALVVGAVALVAGFTAIVVSVGGVVAGLVTLGTLSLSPLLKFGAEYLAQLEQTKLGIASIIASLAELRGNQGQKLEGPAALNRALELADDQLAKLKIDAINTVATFEQIAPAFQSAIGPGLAAGLTLDQIRNTTVQIVQAAGAIGLPANQIAQEVRAILEGTIQQDARLAKILGISNQMVTQWKKQGTLALELNKRLEQFSIAGVRAAETLDGLTSNLQEALNVFAGEATTQAFAKLKEEFAKILPQLFDFKNARLDQSLTALANLIDGLFVRAIDIAGLFIQQLINGTKSVARFVQENRTELDQILNTVADIVKVVINVVSTVARTLGQLVTSKAALLLINDSLTFTKGLVQLIGASVLALTDGFATVANYLIDQFNPILIGTLAIATAITRALGLSKPTDLATGGVTGDGPLGVDASANLGNVRSRNTSPTAAGKKGGETDEEKAIRLTDEFIRKLKEETAENNLSNKAFFQRRDLRKEEIVQLELIKQSYDKLTEAQKLNILQQARATGETERANAAKQLFRTTIDEEWEATDKARGALSQYTEAVDAAEAKFTRLGVVLDALQKFQLRFAIVTRISAENMSNLADQLERANAAGSGVIDASGVQAAADKQLGGLGQTIEDQLGPPPEMVPKFRSAFGQIKDALKDTFGEALDNVGRTFVSLTTGAITLGEAFRSFALSAIEAISQVIIKMLILKAIQVAMSLIGGGVSGAGATGALGPVSNTFAASGGEFSAHPGGRLIHVAEGGHDELVVSTDPSIAKRTAGLLGRFIKRTGILPRFDGLNSGAILGNISKRIPSLAAGDWVSASPALAGAGAQPSNVSLGGIQMVFPNVRDARGFKLNEQAIYREAGRAIERGTRKARGSRD